MILENEIGLRAQNVHRRLVDYILGYDPIPPRRYRELYRKQAARQAAISGYTILVLPKARIGGFGWRVAAEMTSEPVVTDFDVLQWSDLVRNSMAQGIVANYWQTLITIWIYISTGTLARLARLRKGSVLAALYPIVVLVAQLIIGVVAALATAQFLAAVLTPWAALFGVVVLPVILIGFRKLDNRIYAYYLMQDYAFSAQQRGAYPTVLGTRIKGFQAQIAHGLKSDVDEMLVIGHTKAK